MIQPSENPSQTTSRKNIYAFVLLGAIAIITTITVLALGFGRSSNSSRDIDDLQKKLNEMQAKVDQMQPSDSVSSTDNGRGFGDPIDDRILLTLENHAQYCAFDAPTREQCVANLNSDLPSTTVNYDDSARGLSVQIPFNPNWGNATFRLNPYELERYQLDASTTEERLSFGYLSLFEGGGVVRWHGISFIPPRSANEAMDTILEYADMDGPPQKKSVDGTTYIEYTLTGFCETPTIEVIGRKANYIIGPLCGNKATELPFLENIVKSIRFIN